MDFGSWRNFDQSQLSPSMPTKSVNAEHRPAATAPAFSSHVKRCELKDDLVVNCEENTMLLKTAKNIFSPGISPKEGAGAGEMQKNSLCAAAAVGVTRELEVFLRFYGAFYGAD